MWELSWPKHVLPLVKQRRIDAGLHEDPAATWARQAGAERGLLSSEQVRVFVWRRGGYRRPGAIVVVAEGLIDRR